MLTLPEVVAVPAAVRAVLAAVPAVLAAGPAESCLHAMVGDHGHRPWRRLQAVIRLGAVDCRRSASARRRALRVRVVS